MAKFEWTNQITRTFLRGWRDLNVAISDWLNQIRESKSPATLTSNQLSVIPRTERLVQDSGTFETSTCTYFDLVNISSPNFIRVGTLFIFLFCLENVKDSYFPSFTFA